MLFYFLKLNMPGILPKVEPELLTVFFLVAMLKAKNVPNFDGDDQLIIIYPVRTSC